MEPRSCQHFGATGFKVSGKDQCLWLVENKETALIFHKCTYLKACWQLWQTALRKEIFANVGTGAEDGKGKGDFPSSNICSKALFTWLFPAISKPSAPDTSCKKWRGWMSLVLWWPGRAEAKDCACKSPNFLILSLQSVSACEVMFFSRGHVRSQWVGDGQGKAFSGEYLPLETSVDCLAPFSASGDFWHTAWFVVYFQ